MSFMVYRQRLRLASRNKREWLEQRSALEKSFVSNKKRKATEDVVLRFLLLIAFKKLFKRQVEKEDAGNDRKETSFTF